MCGFVYQLLHPWHWLTYGQNASAVAALAAVLGLIGLYWYVRETKLIREASVRQSVAAQIPVPVFERGADGGDPHRPDGRHRFVNGGNGPMLDCFWKVGTENGTAHSNGEWFRLGLVAVREYCAFIRDDYRPATLADLTIGVRIHYRDLAGNTYWYTLKRTEVGNLANYDEDSGTLPHNEYFPNPF